MCFIHSSNTSSWGLWQMLFLSFRKKNCVQNMDHTLREFSWVELKWIKWLAQDHTRYLIDKTVPSIQIVRFSICGLFFFFMEILFGNSYNKMSFSHVSKWFSHTVSREILSVDSNTSVHRGDKEGYGTPSLCVVNKVWKILFSLGLSQPLYQFIFLYVKDMTYCLVLKRLSTLGFLFALFLFLLSDM